MIVVSEFQPTYFYKFMASLSLNLLLYKDKNNSYQCQAFFQKNSKNFLWRVRDSNPRSLGYEPSELPLLQPAISVCQLIIYIR